MKKGGDLYKTSININLSDRLDHLLLERYYQYLIHPG